MEDDPEPGFGAVNPPPFLVSLTPFSPSVSPSPRRLSSHFTEPNPPIRASRKLAWVSLQGRLVGAQEASSARAIGGGMSREEAVAWELFSPIQRILIVAVVAVAAANSKKNRQIYQLRKSVELRKLDNLCEQMNNIKDQQECNETSFTKNVVFPFSESYIGDEVKFVDCGCQPCDQHRPPLSNFRGHSAVKASSRDEPEERRMSDLSDWASSITSSVDIQMNTFAIEHDICNLKKECVEKDATIKELFTFLRSSQVAGSKRITELEDIIRRKNTMITKLKKDLVVLEQKVVHLTRLRRPSFSASASGTSTIVRQLPLMADNLLYDMDNTTSPSSSDSDCSPRNRPQTPVASSQEIPIQNTESAPRRNHKSGQVKGSISLVKPTDRQQKSRPVSPLKEKSMNQRPDPIFLRAKPSLSAGGDLKNSRKRYQSGTKDLAQQKRWV